jgi:uncharacterized protein with HEPN domain
MRTYPGAGFEGSGAVMRDDKERLLDILEAIEKIEPYAARGREAFEKEELIQVWIVHYLQILGEAANKLSQQLRTRYPEVPWGKIIGMRHILVHSYFEIDLEIVWSALENDLKPLQSQIKYLLEDL